MNAIKISLGAAALALTLTSAGLAKTTTKHDPALSGMDKQFITKVGHGGAFEIMSSEVALNKTQDSHVRAVAARMVKEHSAAAKELETVAQDKGTTAPKMPDAKQMAMIRRMKGLSGAAFDKAYMAAQEKSHADTVKLFQSEIAMGIDKDVTAFATKNLPEIEDHTKMIFQVGSNIGVHSVPMPALKGSLMPSGMNGKNM